MPYETLIYDSKDGLAYITINRPAKLNALNRRTIDELYECFGKIQNDSGISAAILTGAGEKSFVAGADIGELSALTPLEARETALKGQRLMNLVENLGKPVIAAINGVALGGGCELAMACTVRIAVENARLGQPEVKLGLIPGYAGTQRLPRLVGKGRALEMILSGDPIDAKEAHRIGLVNRVMPAAELIAEAEKLARRMAANAPIAIRYALECVNRGAEMSGVDGQALEADLFALCCSTDDMREGTRAFLEKRPAKFIGK